MFVSCIGAGDLGPVEILFEGNTRVVELLVAESGAAICRAHGRRQILSHDHIAGTARVTALESENTRSAAHSDVRTLLHNEHGGGPGGQM